MLHFLPDLFCKYPVSLHLSLPIQAQLSNPLAPPQRSKGKTAILSSWQCLDRNNREPSGWFVSRHVKAVQTMIKTALNITGALPRNISGISEVSAWSPKDTYRHPPPPTYSLFTLLLSGKTYKSICCHTTFLLHTPPQILFISQNLIISVLS